MFFIGTIYNLNTYDNILVALPHFFWEKKTML